MIPVSWVGGPVTVSSQVTSVTNPLLGCHYFSSGFTFPAAGYRHLLTLGQYQITQLGDRGV